MSHELSTCARHGFITRLIMSAIAVAALAVPALCATEPPLKPVDGKVGIFDLKAIHSVPLEPQIISKTVDGNIVTEQIRYTSEPGIRVFAYLSYPKGGRNLPVNMLARFVGAEPRKEDAGFGFMGFSVCAPNGNTDESKQESLGGDPLQNDFMDDPKQSWIYHHVVALTRGIDYLATRPEVNMNRLAMSGYSWAGYITALLHAIDDRPACYVTWHSTGYYADAEGYSGGIPSRIKSRKLYEMYAPSAYAAYGSKPIMVCIALTDYFATLDGLMEFMNKVRSPKQLCVAPNRYHANTSRNEFRAIGPFTDYYQNGRGKPPAMSAGLVTAKEGKLIYAFAHNSPEVPIYAEVLYSYGKPGNWTGRTWHRAGAKKTGDRYECSIPVYNPAIPLFAVAQIETKQFGSVANTPQFIDPAKLGITAANAVYPNMLFDFEDKSDLYISVGSVGFVTGQAGKAAAKIKPFQDGTVKLMNIEPFLWNNPKELRFWLYGDGKPGPLTLYMTCETSYWLDHERRYYTKIPILSDTATMSVGWHEYVIPLSMVRNLKLVDSLFFDVGKRELIIDSISWR